MAGRLFAIVGPSGAGKDTLIEAARAARHDLHIARRTITRPEGAGGERFAGVSESEFARLRADGAFALDWRAHGLSYGVPSSIDAALTEGRDVIFNGSRAVLVAAWERYPNLCVIHVTASVPVLAERLAARGRESRDEIARRLARASYEFPRGIPIRVVENDGSLAEAIAAFLAALQPERV